MPTANNRLQKLIYQMASRHTPLVRAAIRQHKRKTAKKKRKREHIRSSLKETRKWIKKISDAIGLTAAFERLHERRQETKVDNLILLKDRLESNDIID